MKTLIGALAVVAAVVSTVALVLVREEDERVRGVEGTRRVVVRRVVVPKLVVPEVRTAEHEHEHEHEHEASGGIASGDEERRVRQDCVLEVAFVGGDGRAITVEGVLEAAPLEGGEARRVTVSGMTARVEGLAVGRHVVTLDGELGSARQAVEVAGTTRVAMVVVVEGHLRGVVKNVGGGAVELVAETEEGEVGLACDADGRFEHHGLGRVRLVASAEGRATTRREVELRAGETVAVELALQGGLPIGVEAHRADGTPVANARATAWPTGDPSSATSITLDERGRGTLRVGGEGRYEVAVLSALASVHAGGEVSLQLPLERPRGEEPVIAITLPALDGAVPARVEVSGEGVLEVAAGEGRLAPDVAGAFTGEVATPARLRARFRGDAPHVYRWVQDLGLSPSGASLRAEPVFGTASITGFIAWQGAAEADVAAAAALALEGPGVVCEQLGVDRAFRLERLPAGRYRLVLGTRVVRELVLEADRTLELGRVVLGD